MIINPSHLYISLILALINFIFFIIYKSLKNKSHDEGNNYCVVAEPKYSNLNYWIFESGMNKIKAENKAYWFNNKYKNDYAQVPSGYHLKAYKISDYEYLNKNNPSKYL